MNPASELRHDIADWVLAMPAATALGFTFASLGDGRCETHLDWQPRHSHVSGAFQAGPIGSLADFTGASAAVSLLPPGTAAATVDLTVKTARRSAWRGPHRDWPSVLASSNTDRGCRRHRCRHHARPVAVRNSPRHDPSPPTPARCQFEFADPDVRMLA